ncbi:MAG: membrane protease YdiL (CAAX protease family) [Verrucomicrobiales bacterium]|jgi:membrane protease YdiL (CAAX protease family)
MNNRLRIWLVFGLAFTVPLIGCLLYFVVSPENAIARWGYGSIKVFLLVWPLVSVFFILPRPQKPAPRATVKPRHLLGLALGGGMGLITIGLIYLVMQTGIREFVMEGKPAVEAKLEVLGWRENYLLWTILIAFVHSAIEEYYWRWFGYGYLQRYLPGIWPHNIAAIGFSAHHYVVVWTFFSPWMAIWLGTMVAIGGFLWSLLYRYTRSFFAPWISHMFVDLGIFWVGWEILTG